MSEDRRILGVHVGVHLGNQHRPTGVTVVEVADQYYTVRHIERIDAGTKYPDIMTRIETIGKNLDSKYGYCPSTYIQCYGELALVIDSIKSISSKNRGLGWGMYPVLISSGDKWSDEEMDSINVLTIGKNSLMSRLKLNLQRNTLELPSESSYTPAILRELEAYDPSQSLVGPVTYGDSNSTGEYNDLLVSLGVGVFPKFRRTPRPVFTDEMIENAFKEPVESWSITDLFLEKRKKD